MRARSANKPRARGRGAAAAPRTRTRTATVILLKPELKPLSVACDSVSSHEGPFGLLYSDLLSFRPAARGRRPSLRCLIAEQEPQGL